MRCISGFKYGRLALLIVLCSGMVAQAQLASRLDQLQNGYEEDRAKGLTLLNKRYIEAYQQEQAKAAQSGDLKKANLIAGIIAKLEKENEQLNRRAALARAAADGAGDHPLIGNTILFAHNRNPDFEARFVFFESGEAYWIGLGNLLVPNYKWKDGEKPLEYLIWSAKASVDTDKPIWKVTVAPDKKSGVITYISSGYNTEIKIRSSRSDEK